MKIYTTHEQAMKDKATTTPATVTADDLLDIGAHDATCEILELMDAIQDDNDKASDCWRVLRATLGKALMHLEVDLYKRLRRAAEDSEAANGGGLST